MRPSEYEPWAWNRDRGDRAGTIAALRRYPPDGMPGISPHRRHRWWLFAARRHLLLRQNEACAVCGYAFEGAIAQLAQFMPGDGMPWPQVFYEVDHIVPLSHDGDHAIDNMQVLCDRCHRTKTATERVDLNHKEELEREWEAKEALRARIADRLASTGPLQARDLALEIGVSTSTITGHLVELRRRGIARHDYPNGWRA